MILTLVKGSMLMRYVSVFSIEAKKKKKQCNVYPYRSGRAKVTLNANEKRERETYQNGTVITKRMQRKRRRNQGMKCFFSSLF